MMVDIQYTYIYIYVTTGLPSGYVKIAIENHLPLIVELAIENGDLNHSYLKLPEGRTNDTIIAV